MKVGDLISHHRWYGIGLIVNIKDRRFRIANDKPYGVLCSDGKFAWFTKNYIEKECEVISESR